MSVENALNRYFQRVELEAKGPQRKNAHPEKDLGKGVIAWLWNEGFSVSVVESKAVYNPKLGRYLSSQTVTGFSDLVGVAPGGLGCFVELKAPGRLSTLRPNQRAFLLDKIERGAFAVVVDSVERLKRQWLEFKNKRQIGLVDGAEYLRTELPKP